MRRKRKRNKQMALINILLKFIRRIEVGSYLFRKKRKKISENSWLLQKIGNNWRNLQSHVVIQKEVNCEKHTYEFVFCNPQ